MNYDRLGELTYFRGRVALCAILKGMGIVPGDEVMVQAFTCLAVPEGVMAAGATPCYVDIEADGFNMDPADLHRKITPRTRAIVVQHTFGIPARLDGILKVANEAHIPVIEDCCHTLRSAFRGKTLGHFGVASFYSFEWGKPIVVGLGGSALFQDDALKDRVQAAYHEYSNPSWMRALKVELQYGVFACVYWPRLYWPVRALFHTMSRLGAAEGNFNLVGGDNRISEDFRLRMPPRQRKRLVRQVRRIDEHADHSRQLACQYAQRISSPSVRHPMIPEGGEVVYARYPLRVSDKPQVLATARKMGLELAEWYSTPIHPVPMNMAGQVFYSPGACPNAETRTMEIVSLPTHLRVGNAYVDRAADFFARI